MCHLFRGVGGWLGAGDRVVVVVDDSVDIIDGSVDMADGGCVGIVNSDVAASRGLLGCVLRVCMAVSLVVGAIWVLTSTGVGAGVVWVSTLAVVTSSVWVSTSSSKTASQNSALAWAII